MKTECEIEEMIPLTVAPNRINYLVISVIKQVHHQKKQKRD